MESPLCPPDTRLIETLGWDGTRLLRLDRHLARARASAAALGFRWDEGRVRACLAPVTGATPLRVRLTVALDGSPAVTTVPMMPAASVWRVALAPERLNPADPFLRHKTTQRALYDHHRAALPAGMDEAIFANRHGLLCEGTITTLFFDLGRGLATPPVACGCLPGILRRELLDSGACTEAMLPLADLGRARLWVGNALRGLIPATLVTRPFSPAA